MEVAAMAPMSVDITPVCEQPPTPRQCRNPTSLAPALRADRNGQILQQKWRAATSVGVAKELLSPQIEAGGADV